MSLESPKNGPEQIDKGSRLRKIVVKRRMDNDQNESKKQRMFDSDSLSIALEDLEEGDANPSSSRNDNFSEKMKPDYSSTMEGDKKKIVIKNLRTKKKANKNGRPLGELYDNQDDQKDSDENDLETHWKIIQESVDAILGDRRTETSQEILFKYVQMACEKSRPRLVYDNLFVQIREYARNLKEELDAGDVVPLSDETCEDYLRRVWKIWKVYPVKMENIRNIFLYLDRIILTLSSEMEVLPIWEATMRTFRKAFFPNVDESFSHTKLFHALFLDLQRMMQRYDVEGNAIQELLSMVSTIHVNDEFMIYFIAQLKEYYNVERQKLLPDTSCNEYFKYAHRQLKEYSDIVTRYFCEQQSLKNVRRALVDCLVDSALPTVLSNGFNHLLESENIDDVRCMYSLCSQCAHGEEHVRAYFVKYIKERGTQLMSCKDDDLFQELLSFKKRMDKIVVQGFVESADLTKFRQAMSDSFESFINTRGPWAAENIARYFHALLRSVNKRATDESLDTILDDAIVIFRFIHGKDVFEAFYKRDLAKRLLLDRSASVDAEKAVLAKLRTECGSGFTHKLEGMFKDMETSEDLNRLYQQHLEHHSKPKSNVNVRVLTTENWPTYDINEISLPKEMLESCVSFSDFYRQQHGTRNLNWHYELSTAVLSAKFRPGVRKELVMALYPGIVLLLFNECEKWTVDEIVKATKISKTEVVRTVISLVGGRGKPQILRKAVEGGKLSDVTLESVATDVLVVNSELSEKLFRIRITPVQLKTTKEDKEKVEAEVNQDRQYQIDAAIVRVMKSRQVLGHHQLMQELFTQLRFPVKAADIKTRIGSLIDRDYLARDADDVNKYKYVA